MKLITLIFSISSASAGQVTFVRPDSTQGSFSDVQGCYGIYPSVAKLLPFQGQAVQWYPEYNCKGQPIKVSTGPEDYNPPLNALSARIINQSNGPTNPGQQQQPGQQPQQAQAGQQPQQQPGNQPQQPGQQPQQAQAGQQPQQQPGQQPQQAQAGQQPQQQPGQPGQNPSYFNLPYGDYYGSSYYNPSYYYSDYNSYIPRISPPFNFRPNY